MQCPVCQVPTLVIEREDIELDYCARCQGVWFDAGELELLVEKLDIAPEGDILAGMGHAPAGSGEEKERKCPLCRRKMEKVALGRDPEIIVDRCDRQDGIWFDGGELARVIEMVTHQEGVEGKATSFLGEVFKGTREEEKEEEA